MPLPTTRGGIPKASLGRARFGDVRLDHRGAGEEETEHQVARDAFDPIAVDEGVLADRIGRCQRVG